MKKEYIVELREEEADELMDEHWVGELVRCKDCACPDDIKSKKWVVGCDGKYGCLCPGHIGKCAPFYVTREQAVEYWNHRPPIAVCDEI